MMTRRDLLKTAAMGLSAAASAKAEAASAWLPGWAREE